MFEREFLRDEFTQLLSCGHESVMGIDHLVQTTQGRVDADLGELKRHAQRHVSMLERLLEIVS